MSVEDAFIADPADPAKRAAWEAIQLELQQLKRPGVERVADHIEHAVAVASHHLQAVAPVTIVDIFLY